MFNGVSVKYPVGTFVTYGGHLFQVMKWRVTSSGYTDYRLFSANLETKRVWIPESDIHPCKEVKRV